MDMLQYGGVALILVLFTVVAVVVIDSYEAHRDRNEADLRDQEPHDAGPHDPGPRRRY